MQGKEYARYYPDIILKELPKGSKLIPLRGYGYVMGVIDKDGRPIGCFNVVDLGYDSVNDWIEKNKV